MLKQFFSLLKRYILPYRKYLTWALILNFLSQWLNVFSFMAIVPILNILFKIDTKSYEYIPMDIHNLDKDVLINNAYYFVSNFVASNGAFYTLAMMGGILIFMTMLKTAGYFASAAVMVPLRTGIVRDIRIQVYNKVLSLPLSFFSEERKGDIIARMSADVTVVENSLTSSIDMLIRNPIALLVCFVTLFSVSWQMTLFVIFILPLTGWIMGVVSRKLKRQSSTAQAQWGDIMSQLDETLGGLRVIKAFIAESKMSARFSKTNNDFRDAMNEMIIRQSSAHPMSEFLGTCVIVTVLLFGGALILNTNYAPMDAATFIFYLIILYSIINPLKEFSRAFYNIPQGLASMERIDMILKAENHIVEPEQPLPLDAFTDKLEFKNVSFSYVEGRPVLNHINLTVPKGKTIALVGQSGSGKSTLVDLVPRYHDVSEGALLIDGKNVKAYTQEALRNRIGYVSQKAILFSGTVAGKVAYGENGGKPADREDIIDAVHTAQADEFVEKLPDTYDGFVAQGGSNLSGGQKQRLSIARAICRHPEIMIFDDSFSALDYKTDRILRKALDEKCGDTTRLIVAQRIGTIRDADKIIVLDEGRIAGMGTHDELMKNCEVYRQIAFSQLSKEELA